MGWWRDWRDGLRSGGRTLPVGCLWTIVIVGVFWFFFWGLVLILMFKMLSDPMGGSTVTTTTTTSSLPTLLRSP